MPRYGKNLNYCLQSRKFQISHESVFHIGLQLLDIFEIIHNAGYIYNDLKLDNILLGYEQKLPADCTKGNCIENISINLVDFGFSTRYIDLKTGEHKGQATEEYFRGNLLFASKYHLHFRKTSRRDDIIGLYYLMIFLLNHGDLPGFDWNKAAKIDQENKHRLICKLKESTPLAAWCRKPFEKFVDFANELEWMQYDQKPNYSKLRNLIQA